MRFSTSLSLLLITIAAAAAACTTSTSSNEESSEQDLTVLELRCNGSADQATKFDISPAFAGGAIEGQLTIGPARTLFVCRTPAADAGTPDLIYSCTERPQMVHPGQWKVTVTKNGDSYEAKIDKGTDGEDTIACTPPERDERDASTTSDGGAPEASLPPVPTYAEVKPLIDGKCNGCHSNGFNSLDKVKQKRAQMISVISGGMMPRGNPTWRTSPEGKKVLDFLRNSPDL